MPEPEVSFRHEFISGAVQMPTGGKILTTIVNRGSSEEYARALVFQKETGFVVQSIDSGQLSVGDLVRPHEAWAWEMGIYGSPGRYWVRILTTSLNLVPSAEYRSLPYGDPRSSVLAYQAPGDLAVFELPFRAPRTGPSIDPVLRDDW